MRQVFKRKEKQNDYIVENVGIGKETCNHGYSAIPKSSCRSQGTRHDRIRNSCWSARGDCDNRNRSFSPQTSRTLGRHCDEYANPLRQLDDSGQSTVEYAIVVGGLITLIVGLGALWQGFDGSLFAVHITASASHNISLAPAPFMADIFRF